MTQLLQDNRKAFRWMLYLLGVILFIMWLYPLAAEKSASRIIQSTMNGVFLGAIYAVIALGIVVINKASGVFNFAHGALMTISAFIFFAFFTSVNISFFAAIAIAAATVLMVITTATVRPLPQNPLVKNVIRFGSVGLFIVVLVMNLPPFEGDYFVPLLISLLKAIGAPLLAFLVLQYFWQISLTLKMFVSSLLATVILVILMSFQPEGGFTLLGLEIESLGWVNALTGAIIGTVLIGLMIERFTVRPMIGQPIFAAVMVTLALAEVLSGFTTLIWGPQPKGLTVFGTPNAFTGSYTRITQPIVLDTTGIFGTVINIDQPRLFAFIIALIAFAGFFIFFRFTNIGLAMRATSEDQQLAESVGLRVRVILAVTWAIASVMAGIAGVLRVGASDANALAPELQYVALRAFPAVLLGGLESISGALVGGIILGLTEEWAKMLFNTDVANNLAPYVMLMIVLIIRPEGLFGEKHIERI